MKIAVDAMGGGSASQAIVEGVTLAKQDFPDTEFQLHGKEAEIEKYITDEKNITIIHTDEKITSDDEPVKAIRRKRTASTVLTVQTVKDGGVDAIFSADNTGALLAAGLFIIGCIKNVERPGLMSTLPIMGEPDKGFDTLDSGANTDNRPEYLVQYVVLDSLYARKIRNIQNPCADLLNSGTEGTKGSELTKRIFRLLVTGETINLVGNVEARGLLNGVADVVVTDGFIENAVLRSIEGTATDMMSLLKTAILSKGVKRRMGVLLLRNALHGAKDEMGCSKHGGAVLFGLRAPATKIHGTMSSDVIRHTVR